MIMARTNARSLIIDSYGNLQKVDVLAGYENVNIDEVSDPFYYGFVDTVGNWFIRKISSGKSTFVRGTSNYTDNWNNRSSLVYDDFDNVF